MGCLFIFVPTSILFASCGAKRSAEKCLQLIMNWGICIQQEKLLASIIWQTTAPLTFLSLELNWLNNYINPLSSSDATFIWSLMNACRKPPKEGSGCFVELEQRGGWEGKLVAFPQIFLKIRRCAPSSLFMLTRGLVLPFIRLALHYSPTPFVMACLDSPSDIYSQTVYLLWPGWSRCQSRSPLSPFPECALEDMLLQ